MTALPSYTDSEQAWREEVALSLELLQRTVIDNPYIPVEPTEPQAVFLTAPVREIMYGGAGGGGKTIALLASALQYVQVPGYAALLLRRTFKDLSLPDGLIPLSHEWLYGTNARWNQENHQWTFPGGSSVTFGYLETERDKFRYKGPSFQFIGFDELTGFAETQYRFLFQRLRRRMGLDVPLRMRSATNPGDIGHEWVKRRFIEGRSLNRLFIPARLEDNPYLDAVSYDASLAELDPVTRRQFRHGDWDVRPEGNLFKRAWFETVDVIPPLVRTVRAWDLAATAASSSPDPDWTVGVKMGMDRDHNVYLLHLIRHRSTPQEVEAVIRQTAASDGHGVIVRIEQEPGSSGKSLIEHYQRDVLFGYAVRGVPATGDKVTRALPFSAACERRAVKLARGEWADEFLDELCAFPEVGHDDQVDAAVGAFSALATEMQLRLPDARRCVAVG